MLSQQKDGELVLNGRRYLRPSEHQGQRREKPTSGNTSGVSTRVCTIDPLRANRLRFARQQLP